MSNIEEKSTETLPEVEIIEIYPSQKKPKKKETKECGTCHVSIKEMGIDIKNIPYFVSWSNTIRVFVPFRNYIEKDPKTSIKQSVCVPTITFHNLKLWKHIQDVVRKEIQRII